MPTTPLNADVTLECRNKHRFLVRWPVLPDGVQVPKTEPCPICGWPGKLVKMERSE